jgi:hypothetical protein
VGGKSFKSKEKKQKPGKGQGENKVAPKKKLKSGLRKGKEKNSTWDGTGIEKRILSVHHPSTWGIGGAGSLWNTNETSMVTFVFPVRC